MAAHDVERWQVREGDGDEQREYKSIEEEDDVRDEINMCGHDCGEGPGEVDIMLRGRQYLYGCTRSVASGPIAASHMGECIHNFDPPSYVITYHF